MSKPKYYTDDEVNYKYDELRRDLYDDNITTYLQDIDKEHNITHIIIMRYNIESRLEEDESWTLEPSLIIENNLFRDIGEYFLQLELAKSNEELMDAVENANFSNMVKHRIKLEVLSLKNRLEEVSKNYYIKGLV